MSAVPEQAQLLLALATHLPLPSGPLPVLFALNTGARDNNVCGLRWSWEVNVPELRRSVFVVPAAEYKGQRDHVLILNDAAWSIVEASIRTLFLCTRHQATSSGASASSTTPDGRTHAPRLAWPKYGCTFRCATPMASVYAMQE